MLSVDTNVLLARIDTDNPNHLRALNLFESLDGRDDVVISELVLLELYVLIRNPAVLAVPLAAASAVDVCQGIRRHPRWQVVGLPAEGRAFHDAFWPLLRRSDLGRRVAFDIRLGLSLLRAGVEEFATANTKDFGELGFKRVWNPFASDTA